MYLPHTWPFGIATCRLAYPVVVLFTFIDWASLSMVALTRCLNILTPNFWNNFCEKKRNALLTMASTWIYGGLVITIYLIKVNLVFNLVIIVYLAKISIDYA